MCQLAVRIPDAVLFDTHMTESQSEELAKKIIALHYYLHFHVSLGYCAQIAEISEEDFIKFLKRGEDFKYSLKFELNDVKAPISMGECVGKLYVLDENNMVVSEHDLVVHDEVKKITLGEILYSIFEKL